MLDVRSLSDVLTCSRSVEVLHDLADRHPERVTSMAEELEGASWMADERRVARHDRHAPHLASQQVDDRGLH